MRSCLLALAFAVAGCSVFEPGAADMDLPTAFVDARETWEAQEPQRYEFEIQDLAEGSHVLRIVVERGEVTRVLVDGERTDASRGMTISSLFDTIESAYRDGAYLIEANYWAARNYPRYARIDPDREVSGDETGWHIRYVRGLISTLTCDGCEPADLSAR